MTPTISGHSEFNVLTPLEGYALWAISAEPLASRLKSILHTLSHQYNTTLFPPHITILSVKVGDKEQLKAHCKALANSFSSFDICFDKIGESDSVYRCLYLLPNQSDDLYNLHNCAKRILSLNEPDNYFPHLSLIYGAIPQQEKENVKKVLQQILPLEGTINSLALWSINETPEQWRELAIFPLRAVH